MELIDYLQIVWRRKWVILCTTLVTTAIVVVGVIRTPMTYTATAQLRIVTPKAGNPGYVEYELQYADRIMNTYVEIASSGPVLAQVKEKVGFTATPKIEVTTITDTELLEITVEDTDPVIARDTANALAEILMDQRVTSGNQVYLVDPATMPEPSSMVTQAIYIAAGFVVGLMGGTGLAFLFENLDTRLYTAERIERATKLPVLGKIPVGRFWRRPTRFFIDSFVHGEAFRRLRIHIMSSAGQDVPLKTLLVTSTGPKEGKSTIAANLALSMAQAGLKVIVVDADLRRPTLHAIFDLPNEVGLESVLGQKVDVSKAIGDNQVAGVHVLTSGPPHPSPPEMLGSPQMAALIEQLEQQFDIVLLDTPAFLSAVDASILAPLVGGVLLIVRHAWVQEHALVATCQQLTRVNAKLIGVIVNRAGRDVSPRYYKYYQRAETKEPPSDSTRS